MVSQAGSSQDVVLSSGALSLLRATDYSGSRHRSPAPGRHQGRPARPRPRRIRLSAAWATASVERRSNGMKAGSRASRPADASSPRLLRRRRRHLVARQLLVAVGVPEELQRHEDAPSGRGEDQARCRMALQPSTQLQGAQGGGPGLPGEPGEPLGEITGGKDGASGFDHSLEDGHPRREIAGASVRPERGAGNGTARARARRRALPSARVGLRAVFSKRISFAGPVFCRPSARQSIAEFHCRAWLCRERLIERADGRPASRPHQARHSLLLRFDRKNPGDRLAAVRDEEGLPGLDLLQGFPERRLQLPDSHGSHGP